jgi:sugar fermentation stimulation protein A
MAGIRFPRALVAGRFLRRLNRFAAMVEIRGRRERAHVRNSGRLRELLTPGRRIWLEPSDNPRRQTGFTLALVRLSRGYASADAQLPNALVAEGLRRGAIPGLEGYHILRTEPRLGRRRADFLLTGGHETYLLEVKSATLVREGIALFPDAPTARGRAHVEHLMAARRRGVGAGVLFIIQREDVRAFAPNRAADPALWHLLRRAAKAGVQLRAMTCRVGLRGVHLGRSLPVRWHAAGVAMSRERR